MSITFDHILASQGTQLTDEELQQLSEIVETQRKERSVLNNDVDFDKSKGKYKVNYYDKHQRKRIWINNPSMGDVTEIMVTGALPGNLEQNASVECPYPEPKQFKFMRITKDRRSKVLHRLRQLRGTINSGNYIDLPVAQDTLEKIEEEVARLRKTYEEEAKKLITKVNKKKGIRTI